MKITKKKTISLTILLMLSGLLIAYICINSSSGWMFIKVNDKLYVANSLERYDEIEYKQIGATQIRGFSFLKPNSNWESNMLSYGCFIYEGENENEIFLELKDTYIKLVSIDTENWEDGIKVTVDDL